MLLIISNVGIHLIIVVLHILVILIESLGELFTIFLLKKTVFFQDFGKIRFNFFHIYVELIHGQQVTIFESWFIFLTHLDGFDSKLLTLGLNAIYLLLQVLKVDISDFFIFRAVFLVSIVAIFFSFVWFFEFLNLSL